jgi:UPF0755 protein
MPDQELFEDPPKGDPVDVEDEYDDDMDEYEEDEDEDDGEYLEEKRKSPLLSILLVLVLLTLGAMAGIYGGRFLQSSSRNWEVDLEPAGPPDSEDIIFTLERGWTLSRTAEALYESRLIRSADSFIRLGKQANKAESLKAGRFLLSSSMSSQEILDELVRGSVLTTRFTIPEGYTLKRIAKVFAEKGICGEDVFWQYVRTGEFDYPFLEGLPADEHRLEGYLFPDTYIIDLDEPVDRVMDRMLRRYEEIWDSVSHPADGLNDRDALILASIVQNEIRLDEERPLAASVFLNRLAINMPLQSDATVQYYFDEPKYPLLLVDLEIDFPYNTYKYGGLPPGPVCSPGKASLAAAATPGNTEYLYFVAKSDGTGGSYFSKTLNEHNNAVAQSRVNRGRQ